MLKILVIFRVCVVLLTREKDVTVHLMEDRDSAERKSLGASSAGSPSWSRFYFLSPEQILMRNSAGSRR